jgi:hypothetical protein
MALREAQPSRPPRPPRLALSRIETGMGHMFSLRIKQVLVAGLLSFGVTTAHSAELIVNGGFEIPGADVFSAPGWVNGSAPGEVVKFIPITDYNPCCAPFGVYPFGSRAAFFGGGDTVGGDIYQDIATIAGQSYSFSFVFGAISEVRLQQLKFGIDDLGGGGNILSVTVPAVGTQNLTTMMNAVAGSFIAKSGSTRISFDETNFFGTTSVDLVVDAVSVMGPTLAPIPEPSTYLLMLGGLGFVAYAARRRQRRGKAA